MIIKTYSSKIMSQNITDLKKHITRYYRKLSKEETLNYSSKIKLAIEFLVERNLKNTFKGLDMSYINSHKILKDGFKARQEFFLVNQAFALNKAMRYRGSSDADCVVQEAMVGLMRACELYDATTGFAFTTYADAWIRRAVLMYKQTETNSFKINPVLLSLRYKVKKIAKERELSNQPRLTLPEMAALFEVKEDDIKKALSIPCVISANETVGSEDEATTKLDQFTYPEPEEVIDYSKMTPNTNVDPFILLFYSDIIYKLQNNLRLSSHDKDCVRYMQKDARIFSN